MWPYWVLFLIPALMAVQRMPRANALRYSAWGAELWLFWFFMVLLIGLRYEVGADWDPYLRYLSAAADFNFWQIFATNDAGYNAMNWLSSQLGLGIVGVNLICGAIFASGLISFSRTLSRPWLAITVAVPYMVIVVAMGYVRQGVALGLIMTGLAWLQRGYYLRYLTWVLAAATFHKPAILMVMFALATWEIKYILKILVAGLICVVGIIWFLQDSIPYLVSNYISAAYHSDGAFIRILMNVFPALIFFALVKSFHFTPVQKRIWGWMSVAAIILFGILFFFPSSAAVDRIAVYLIPLQLAVFANVPDALRYQLQKKSSVWIIAIIALYASVQFVWLMFATHATKWIPYRIFI